MESNDTKDTQEKQTTDTDLPEILEDFGSAVVQAVLAGVALFTSGKAVINILE